MTPSDADAQRIRSEVQRRGISRVIHFTQSRKLAQILGSGDGVKSSAEVRRANADVFDANDARRFDNHHDHISCSVEYPNYWMLRTFQRQERFFLDWAMLVIDPAVLWQPRTLFAPRNAAAGGGSLLASGSGAFEGMFAPQVQGAYGRIYVRPQRMLDCVPTDDQAEVMVWRHIPLEQIRAVLVPTSRKAKLEIDRLSAVGPLPDLDWIVAPDLFTDNVSTFVRQGTRPREVNYVPDADRSRADVE